MVSSANVLIFTFAKQLGMSLIYIKNKSGPRLEPCGTPHWIESGSDLIFQLQHIVFCFQDSF